MLVSSLLVHSQVNTEQHAKVPIMYHVAIRSYQSWAVVQFEARYFFETA